MRLAITCTVALIVGCAAPPKPAALPEPASRDTHVANGNPGGGMLGALGAAPAALATAVSASSSEGRAWLGWDVQIDGDRMRWRPCADAEHCQQAQYTAAASELIGVKTVGLANLLVDGAATRVEVKQLRFRPDSDAEHRLESAARTTRSPDP